MGKCIKCGRKGLFFKVSQDGYCATCKIEVDHKARLKNLQEEIASKEARLSEVDGLLQAAIEEARTTAMKMLAREERQLQEHIELLNDEKLKATAARDAIILELRDVRSENETLVRRNEKLKPLANSIKHAFRSWVEGDSADELASKLESLRIEDLLPQPELNCLTMKQLRARYNQLRKQIVELCAAYESRYTTKSNAALYKLMVLALEAELENVLHKLQFGKLDVGIAAVKDLTVRYYAIAADGNQSIAPTLKRFIGEIESLYLEVVATEYEYYVQRERAREEQRALREEMRQEAEERKRLEAERKRIEKEEQKYNQEMERIRQQLLEAQNEASEAEALRKRLVELEKQMTTVEEKKAEIVNLQNGKAGTVYIISNLGSFGDDVFKIGMTRRLEPQDRINELGDASVPFPFDVHSFIFSQDAPALETQLHKELNDRRLNKVNLRKEFFNISLEELKQLVEKIDPTAPFKETMLAEQYRQSQNIETVPEFGVQISIDEE